MNLFKKINNKKFNVTLIVMVLLFGVLIKSVFAQDVPLDSQSVIRPKYTESEIIKYATEKTQIDSGIIMNGNGTIKSAANENESDLAKTYNNMNRAGLKSQAATLAQQMFSLYNQILPLEISKVSLVNKLESESLTKAETTSINNQIKDINSRIGAAQNAVALQQEKVGYGSYLEKTSKGTYADNPPPKAERITCLTTVAGLPSGISIPGCIAIVSYFILYLTSWVLFVSAIMFDWTIAWALSMHDIIKGFSAIQYGWETLRNFINLFFILILIYISIATILQISSYGYKQLLGKLVMAAFLINFSMFFTEIIIDVSNMTALVFYQQVMIDAKIASNVSANNTDLGAGSAASSQNQYLSLGIMNALGLQSVWGVAKANKGAGDSKNTSNDPASEAGASIASGGGAGSGAGVLNPWTMTLVGLGGSAFILILSFIFFAASVMFIIRVVMLIILIITSPIAFAAKVLPQTSDLSSKWWKQLNSNALFAPVYMALMFVTLKMVWGGSNKVTNLLSLFTNSGQDTMTGGIQAIVFFVLLCSMLVMCLVVASSIGAMGSKTLHSWGKSMGTTAKNYASSRAMAPVSRMADAASKSKLLSSGLGRALGGAVLLQGADKLAGVKVGGSTYRSRLADNKKTYLARGELIKKAVTGEVERKAGESNEDFLKRKAGAEGKGRSAQQTYFGAAGGVKTSSGSIFKSKRQAGEDVLDSAGKAKNAPGSKITEAANNSNFKIVNSELISSLSAIKDATAKKEVEDLIESFTEYVKKDGVATTEVDKEKTAKNIKPERIIEKLNKPIKQLDDEISALTKQMNILAQQTISSAGHSGKRSVNLDVNRAQMEAFRSLIDSKKSEAGAIKSAISKLEANEDRKQQAALQSDTRTAIEKNAPKS